MPFKKGDSKKHNKGLSTSQDTKWVKIANGVLERCRSGKLKPRGNDSCDATAIKIANSSFKKREDIKLVGDGAFINIVETADKVFMLEDDKVDKSNRIAPMRIIKEGMSKNNRFYSREVAESFAKFMKKGESRKMFMDHPREFVDFFGRSMKDWTGTAKEAWAEDGQTFAMTKILENHNGWIWEAILDSPRDVGVSINAIGDVEEDKDGSISGKKGVMVVKKIDYLISADFVNNPAAGGQALKSSQEAVDYGDPDFAYLPFMQEQAYYYRVIEPLVEAIVNEGSVLLSDDCHDCHSKEGVQMEPLTNEQLRGLTHEQLVAAGNLSVTEAAKTASEKAVKEATGSLNEQIASLGKENKELTEKVATQTEELKILTGEKEAREKEIAEAKAKQAEVEAGTFVEKLVKSFTEGFITEERIARWKKQACEDKEGVQKDADELTEIVKSVKAKTETATGKTIISARQNLLTEFIKGAGGNGETKEVDRKKLAQNLMG